MKAYDGIDGTKRFQNSTGELEVHQEALKKRRHFKNYGI